MEMLLSSLKIQVHTQFHTCVSTKMSCRMIAVTVICYVCCRNV